MCCESPEERHSSESRRWRGDDKECTSRLYTERDWATVPGCLHPAKKLKGAGLCRQVGAPLTQSKVLRVRGGDREGREWGVGKGWDELHFLFFRVFILSNNKA